MRFTLDIIDGLMISTYKILFLIKICRYNSKTDKKNPPKSSEIQGVTPDKVVYRI